jgi:hypothetical protein
VPTSSISKYAAIALSVLLAICVGACIYIGYNYVDAKEQLSIAASVNEANNESILRMERSANATDKIISGYNNDRTLLNNIRSEVRKAIREESDAILKEWRNATVPDGAWRLLGQTLDTTQRNNSRAANGTSTGLPGNTSSGTRDKR